ncbi:translation regulator [Diplodia corticola]|uniref:Translation regulator n=1 Tax=Diplodia corticola TaxID=236234 RepID=A0A1J9S410_9PEZI|nr:translation regulator [Diplodia corticola]OJD34373.1 translation regulator [Diplodia corticola]
MLHSSFWHHGAGDLDLPTWWASALQHSPAPDSQLHDPPEESGRNAARQTPAPDGLFLDFLYPAKTLALMHRLSNCGWEGWQAHQTRVATTGRVRHYSSKTTGPGNENEPNATSPFPDEDLSSESDAFGPDANADAYADAYGDFIPASGDHVPGPNRDDPFQDISPMPVGNMSGFDSDYLEDLDTHAQEWVQRVENPSEQLRFLLEDADSDSKVVWKLWKMAREADPPPELAASALEYFVSVRPFIRTLADEVVAIFNALAMQDRRASSYKGAIISYLRMGKLGKAALVHEEGIESRKALGGNIATSDLLAHAIAQGQWQLAIEAYTAMGSLIGPQLEFWSVVKKNHKLPFLTESFLIHFRRMRLLTGRKPEEQDQIHAFATEFGARAIKQFAHNARSAASGLNLYRLLMRLRRDGFLEARHFELALQGLLGSKSVKQAGELPLVVRKLFHKYIAIAKADPSITVNDRVLYTVLYAIKQTMNISQGSRIRGPRLDISHVVDAAAHFFERPPNAILELLMDAFSQVGDVQKTKVYFRQVPVPQRKPWHWEYVLKAFARRGDTIGATQMFEELTQEMGRTPHVRAWNTLLHAFARDDDLVGANRVFEKLMESSIRPDAYSFTAMLDLLSQRGDVDGVKDMFALASDVDPDITKSTDVAGYLVTAFINNDDLDTAEMVAEQLWKRRESGRMQGSFRPIWNLLATAYALRRDVASTRRIYEDMQSNDTAPDEMTYAALLQALCLTRNTDAAHKILRLVIPTKPAKPMALHYAIVMAGYINEGSYEKVPAVDRLRKMRGIRPSTSTRITVAKAVALSEHIGRYKKRQASDFTRTNKVVTDMVLKESAWEWVMEPQTGLGFRSLGEAAGAYLDIVMLIQGDKGAFDTVEQLYQVYGEQREKLRDPDTNYTAVAMSPPLRMLVSLMNTQFKAGVYEDVERLWNLAVEKAAVMTQQTLPEAAKHPEHRYPRANPLSPTRRHLLSRPLVIYLRALHFQGRYADAQRVVSGLLDQGYTLDNLAWNLYLQLLARTGRISLAFSLCEQYLMDQWIGWRFSEQGLRRRYTRTRGWEYMNINPNRTKPNVVMPQYRTMVFLAAALKYVRRLRAVGGGRALGDDDGMPLTEELLRSSAPRTMAALQAMPLIDDDLQTKFLRDD